MSQPEILLGIAGSHGVALAPAVVLDAGHAGYPRRKIREDQAEAEWGRFEQAVCDVQADLRKLINTIAAGRPEASILEAYLLMVCDETLARLVREQIDLKRRCADWGVATSIKMLARQLGEVEDPYIRERSHDVNFVGERLLRALAGVDEPTRSLDLSEPAIVVAHDLSPADTAAMIGSPVLALVTEMGSRTSHTAIMARSLEIPAVVGCHEALLRIDTGDSLIVDGLRGTVTVNPSVEQQTDARRRAARYRTMAQQLGERRAQPAKTTEGTRVHLHANIELPAEAKVAIEHGAEGVGLYRTEFLYVDRHSPPSEEDQFEIFRGVVRSMGERPVTLRTFDIGGDKFMSSFQVPKELNPMLGLRAVRLQLTQPEVLLAHLRAMVRASAFGKVRIMIPLVCTVDELFAVRGLLERAKEQVRQRGEPMAEEIPLGVMIEVPAAAVTADIFAREVDFMSIGTNDLVQYALAIDRTNRTLAYLASPFHPSILRLINQVLRAGEQADCPVSLCGEMASEPYGALLLVGLGMRKLSMESVAIPEIKEAISRSSLAELQTLAKLALDMRTAHDVEQLMNDALEPRLHDLLTGQPSSSAPGGDEPTSSSARFVTTRK